jgi:cytochrome c-type biogenesis protein CcsB
MISEINFLLFQAIIVVTLCSTAVYIVFFVNRKEKVRTVAGNILLFSGILQTLYIITRYFLTGHTPITSEHETTFFFVWAMTWAYLSFRRRYTVKNFGTFTSILISLLVIVSAVVSKDISPLPPVLKSWWLPVHAGVTIIAYAFLGLAFVGGLMYLVQEWELKSKRLGYFFSRLPSLDALDQLNNHCLTTGFIFLTLGIVTGTIWARQAVGSYWRWDPKEIWTMITWFIYLIQFHQRITVGWRGKRAAIMAIIGFCSVIFTLWGVAYLLGGDHSYAR